MPTSFDLGVGGVAETSKLGKSYHDSSAIPGAAAGVVITGDANLKSTSYPCPRAWEFGRAVDAKLSSAYSDHKVLK